MILFSIKNEAISTETFCESEGPDARSMKIMTKVSEEHSAEPMKKTKQGQQQK